MATEVNPALGEEPVIHPKVDINSVTEMVPAPIESPRPPKAWFISFGLALLLLGNLGLALAYLIFFGIGHAGTLISAVLFLFRQKWRTSINRFAEAMTIFAVVCALMFPTIHVGRAWYAYYMFPLPNEMSIWPNFKSPLLWDVFAVSTYFTVSTLFWFVGLVPDFAPLRNRAKTKYRRIVYGALALGW